MEREAVLVGIDVGTSKVCALIGEVGRDGRLTIMGHGTVPASGLKKGVVINIDQTVRSIADAVEKAERLSGWKIDRAFVGVGALVASRRSHNHVGWFFIAAGAVAALERRHRPALDGLDLRDLAGGHDDDFVAGLERAGLDAAGNNDGLVCALPLPDAFCTAMGYDPCPVETVYLFSDNNVPVG